MLKIPGIDAERVQLYGKTFIPLINRYQDNYNAMMTNHDDRPQDPNHQIVTIISDDEDDAGNDDLDDFDDDGSQGESSTYFPSREVEAWNAQCKCFDTGLLRIGH